MAKKQQRQNVSRMSTRREDSIMFIVAYVLPVLSGLFVYLLYGHKDQRLRFQSAQSIIYWIAVLIVYYVLTTIFSITTLFVLMPIAWIFFLLAWLYGLWVGYQAFLGNDMSLPTVGELAKTA